MQNLVSRFINLYPVWVALVGGVSYFQPELLLWLQGPWVVWGLCFVMLGMGINLTFADFRRIFQMPSTVLFGLLLQHLMMPLLAWVVSQAMSLSPELTVGLILVACCPTGVASSVVSFLAQAHVALSAVLTLSSSLSAFLLTPLMCEIWAGEHLEIDALGLSLSTFKIAFLPVLLGALINWRIPKLTKKLRPWGPPYSVLALTLITGGIVSASAGLLRQHYMELLFATTALHVLGFGLGYALSKILRYPEDFARTLSITTGIQNCGLAALLARQHFTLLPAVALPAVFSAVIQNLTSSLLATWWRRRSEFRLESSVSNP